MNKFVILNFLIFSLHFPAIRHIHEDSVPGLVDAQSFALFVDMRDHLVGVFHRIRLTVPHTAVDLFQLLVQIILKYRSPVQRHMIPVYTPDVTK